MGESEQTPAEKTYRAIGRFMFEFSQVEYTIRHYLAEEIGLNEEHFAAVVESYDVGVLCTVTIEVFTRRGRMKRLPASKNSLNVSASSMMTGNVSPTGSGCPSKKVGPCITCPVAALNRVGLRIRLRRWNNGQMTLVRCVLS